MLFHLPKFPTGTPKECQRMVVDGGKEQPKAVVLFTTVPFLAGVVFSMNLQNGFKDGTTASEKVQENTFDGKQISSGKIIGAADYPLGSYITLFDSPTFATTKPILDGMLSQGDCNLCH